MDNRFLAKVGALFSLLILYSFALSGCAYSNVERNVTANIDKGVETTRTKMNAVRDSTLADSYQNASQQTKGAILGGAAGGVTGAAISSIGILPGLLVGSIFGASYGAYIERNASLADKLQNRGVTLVVLGDQILIVVPSARLFEPMSAKIKPDAYSTLNLVARYVNGFTKMLVKIGAYTNPMRSSDIALCLSQEQAESVARYFVASGLDARLLYAAGYGGAEPVQKSSCAFKENDNYRIEITLERQHDDCWAERSESPESTCWSETC